MNSSTSHERDYCSNHGYYSDSGCVCDNGWADVGCFALVEGPNCDIKEKDSQIIWCATLIISVICLIPTLRLLFVRIRKRGSIWIFTYEAKSLYPLTVLISLYPYILFSVLKIIYSDQQLVGRDILITMVYMLCPMLTFFTLVCYFFIVIRFLKSLTATMAPEIGNKIARRFNLLTTLVLCIPPLAIITCGMPVMGIPFPRYRNIFAKFSLIGNGVLASMYGLIVLNALGFLLRELLGHIESIRVASDGDLRIVYKRLNLAYGLIANNAFTVAFSSFIFGCWDFLLKKSLYVFVYQICGCALGTIVLIITISGISTPPPKVLPVESYVEDQRDHSIPLASGTQIATSTECRSIVVYELEGRVTV